MAQSDVQITDAEWEVMLSVWEADDQAPAEIIARVQPLRKRSHRTVRTLLARLLDKGAVSVREEGTQRLYSAAVTRDACVRAAASSFRERFFAGNVQSMLLHFVESESLSDEEIEALKQRLDSITSDSTSSKQKSSRLSGKRRKRS